MQFDFVMNKHKLSFDLIYYLECKYLLTYIIQTKINRINNNK